MGLASYSSHTRKSVVSGKKLRRRRHQRRSMRRPKQQKGQYIIVKRRFSYFPYIYFWTFRFVYLFDCNAHMLSSATFIRSRLDLPFFLKYKTTDVCDL